MTQETSISRHCPPIEVLGAHRVRPKKRRPETSEVIRVSEPETLRSTWIKKKAATYYLSNTGNTSLKKTVTQSHIVKILMLMGPN